MIGQWYCANCMKKMTNPRPRRTTWERDNIQFPRLLAELSACGLTSGQMRMLEDSMDLTTDEINELLQRAEVRWGEIKNRMNAGAARRARRTP